VSSPDVLPLRPRSAGPLGVGIVGGGDIAPRYAELLRRSDRFTPVAIAARTQSSAVAAGARTGLPATSLAGLLAEPQVELVLNLTPPLAHAAVTAAALQARRHVYSEKPLAADLPAARRLIRLAWRQQTALACAPATFLGPVWQEARRLIDAGALGQVLSARGAMVYPEPDQWHASPEALFGAAAGPVFDMGVYHVTTLVALLGPIRQIWAAGSRACETRTVRTGPRAGATFGVSAMTHVETLLTFHSGASASLVLSFDGMSCAGPGLELLGTAATLKLPQPGQFEGPMALSTRPGRWDEAAPKAQWPPTGWIAGLHALLDHLEAPQAERVWPMPRLALHVLEALAGIDRAARTGRLQTLRTTCPRPPALDVDAPSRWANAGEVLAA
jgi:predicted dehydrogenase